MYVGIRSERFSLGRNRPTVRRDRVTIDVIENLGKEQSLVVKRLIKRSLS